MMAVKTSNGNPVEAQSVKDEIKSLQSKMLDRLREVLPEAYKKMHEGNVMENGVWKIPEVKTSLEEDDGAEKFHVVIEGANYFSEDKEIIRMEKERQELKNKLNQITSEVNNKRLA